MPPPFTVTFSGSDAGPWRIERLSSVSGPSLAAATHLALTDNPGAAWRLSGVVSHQRYSTAAELKELAGVQAGLGRSEATCAALIPIRKSEAWWSMAQDERRAIFEERSRHIALSMKYLPAVARRLHHARDLGEPFDFLTWFEFAPEHEAAFDALLAELRASEEWKYVEREVEIRLTRTR
ncbi:MAG: chlorite dismutase [Reyranella sp.]|uniref:chlorite dismutase family protein n=1 Tax=Reyranella sp. TaxID=1929291 RepID=UPI00121F7626|nr:chlorite dismutase family protein [Reyranella sp.]TAJ85010.1 MAG: chlorite dismutase [Reyranella sp.]TBR26698.1 MAG: chlorite dismutase [Reyranella sp.]